MAVRRMLYSSGWERCGAAAGGIAPQVRRAPANSLKCRPRCLEVRVLVEARAGRGEQDDVAGPRRRAGRGDRVLEVAAVGPGAAAPRAGARRPAPISSTEAARAATGARSGAKSSPLASSPPRIRRIGAGVAASATSVDSTLVALESLTQRTPSRTPRSSRRCSTPGERAQRLAHGVGVHPARQADGRGGHRVGGVVGAAAARARRRAAAARRPRRAARRAATARRRGPRRSSTRRAQPPRSSIPRPLGATARSSLPWRAKACSLAAR